VSDPARRLTRSLGLGTLTALVVGEVIGIGIFLTPADMARTLGSPGLLLMAWLLMGAMAMSGAVAYGALAVRYPEAGGPYVYLRQAWGGTVAFLYGWQCLLVLDPGLTAAWASGVAQYASALLPLGPRGATAVAVATILVLAGLNALGTRVGAWVLLVVTVLKVVLLAMIVGWGLLSGRGELAHFTPFWERAAGSPPLGAAIAAGFVSAFFSFGGWWDAAKMAGEAKDPERNLPRAFSLGVLGVTLVYILTSAVFVYLIPIPAASSSTAFAAVVGEKLFGRAGGLVLAGTVLVAVLGSLAAYVLSAPRVYLAMAADGVFPAALARRHPRLGTPLRAIALQAGLACVLVTVGSFGEIVAYFLFAVVAFIGMSVAALWALPPEERRSAPRWVVAVFLALTAALLVLLALGSPRHAALGTAVVLLGIPVRAWLRRREAAARS
jgi:basic amino acid/polyamine antiporter, APA family